MRTLTSLVALTLSAAAWADAPAATPAPAPDLATTCAAAATWDKTACAAEKGAATSLFESLKAQISAHPGCPAEPADKKAACEADLETLKRIRAEAREVAGLAPPAAAPTRSGSNRMESESNDE
jgi:hypothetical protein